MSGFLVTGGKLTNYVSGMEGRREWQLPLHPLPRTGNPVTKHHSDMQTGSYIYIPTVDIQWTLSRPHGILVENFHFPHGIKCIVIYKRN